MDGGERRSSQYGQPYQTPTTGRPAPGQPMGPPADTRYSQSVPSASRGTVGRSYVPGYPYNFQESQYQANPMQPSNQMPGVELHYGSGYAHEGSGRHQLQSSPTQHPQYSPYGQGSMMSSGAPQSMYEGMQQYQQQRQVAALEVMPGQFGGIPSYLPPTEAGAVGIGSGTQYDVSQADTSSYGAMSMSRPQLQAPFQASTSEYQPLGPSESHDPREESTSMEALESGRQQYEEQLKATYTDIAAGRVTQAANQLLALSRWLLPMVRALGLHHDDAGQYEQRLSFWREFNHAWEALGQKQKNITEAARRSQQQPADILSIAMITNMIDELIRLCDQIEKYGLVDYELGVWEEQIVGIFTQCLDLLNPESERGDVVAQLVQHA